MKLDLVNIWSSSTRKVKFDQGLANVPIEHHPTLGDWSPTDIWRWCSKSPKRDFYQPLLMSGHFERAAAEHSAWSPLRNWSGLSDVAQGLGKSNMTSQSWYCIPKCVCVLYMRLYDNIYIYTYLHVRTTHMICIIMYIYIYIHKKNVYVLM